MRAWVIVAAVALVAASAGCLAEREDEAAEGECPPVGTGDEAGGMRGNHCPNETPGQWMVNEGI